MDRKKTVSKKKVKPYKQSVTEKSDNFDKNLFFGQQHRGKDILKF